MHKLLQNRSAVWSLSFIYLLVLGYLLFFAFFREGTTTEVNLIPFKTIGSLTWYTLRSGEDLWHWFVNVPGNWLAFMPAGLPLFLIRERFSKPLFNLVIFLIPIALEFLQYLFQTGSCDVDDVILNVLGIYTGFWLLKKMARQPVK